MAAMSVLHSRVTSWRTLQVRRHHNEPASGESFDTVYLAIVDRTGVIANISVDPEELRAALERKD